MPRGVHKNHARGAAHFRWRGGRRVKPDGYVTIRESGGVERYEHILIIEAVLGKPMPEGAVTHHVDDDRGNNVNSNFVLCQDHSYHSTLHQRRIALRETGDPTMRKCCFCHEWDHLDNLKVRSGGSVEHRECHNAYKRKWAFEHRDSVNRTRRKWKARKRMEAKQKEV